MPKSVEQLEAEREALLRDYISVQDQMDTLNGREYDLACAIRAVDLALKAAREERARAISNLSLAAGLPPPAVPPTPGHN